MNVIDFSQIGPTGGVQFNGEAIGAAYFRGERLWPWGLDLLFAGGVGGGAYLPEDGATFSDAAGSTPAAIGGTVGMVRDSKSPAGPLAIQSSSALRPVLGRAPSHVRNLLYEASEGYFARNAFGKNGMYRAFTGVSASAAPVEMIQTRFGTLPFYALTEDASNGAHWFVLGGNNSGGFSSWGAGVATVSWIVKRAGRRYAVLRHYSSTPWREARFDFDNPGSVTLQAGSLSIGGETVGQCEPLGNDLFRLSLRDVFIGGGFQNFRLGTADDAGDTLYTGDERVAILASGMQVELGELTNYQRVGAATDITEANVPSFNYLRLDGVDDKLTHTFPNGLDGDVLICGRNGSWIEEGVSVAPGGTLDIGPVNGPKTPGIVKALGDIVGWVAIDKTLSASERSKAIRYFKERGAKGLLAPGDNLFLDETGALGDFDIASDVSAWVTSNAALTHDAGNQALKVTTAANGYYGHAKRPGLNVLLPPGGLYLLSYDVIEPQNGGYGPAMAVYWGYNDGSLIAASARSMGVGSYSLAFSLPEFVNSELQLRVYPGNQNSDVSITNISIRKLTPSED